MIGRFLRRDSGQSPIAQPHIDDVPIREDMIRLGQFLKLANFIDNGSDAKWVLSDGAVMVNGEPEDRRGRQLIPGDVVTFAGQSARVVHES